MPAKEKTDAQKEQERKESLLRKQAHYQAHKKLREAHSDEFDDLVEKECAALNVPYTRPLKPIEKARTQVQALFDQYPDLAAEFSDAP